MMADADRPLEEMDALQLAMALELASYENGLHIGHHLCTSCVLNWSVCACKLAADARQTEDMVHQIRSRLIAVLTRS